MKLVSARWSALLPTLILLAAVPERPSACDCITLPALSPAVRTETPVILQGRVVEIIEREEHTRTTYPSGAKSEVRPIDRQIVFEVQRAWNGIKQARFAVSSPISDCMFQFDLGGTYLVFAHRKGTGHVWTDRCTRTSRLEAAGAILAALGPPTYVGDAKR